MEVASRLAAQGVRAVGVAARHSAGEPTPEEVGLTIPVLNSALPRRFLYAAWDRLSMPRVDRMLGVGSGGGTQVVHATTWAIPPTSRPLVVTVHDVAFLRDASHFTSHGAAYFNRALDITKHRADAVIVPSEATARDCIEAGIDEGLITVIPHGLTHTPVTDSQVEDFRARHGLTRPYILWVGTREPRKNLPTLLRAYRAMASSTDLDLVLVGPAGWGEDPEWGDLPAERTHVLGRLDDTDLACAYAGARVFTFPSIWEGFGLPVLEAMAHRYPRRHQRRHLHGGDHGHRRGSPRAGHRRLCPRRRPGGRRRKRARPPGRGRPRPRHRLHVGSFSSRPRPPLRDTGGHPMSAGTNTPGAGEQNGAARRSARVVLVNWKNAPLTLRAARSIAPQLAPG